MCWSKVGRLDSLVLCDLCGLAKVQCGVMGERAQVCSQTYFKRIHVPLFYVPFDSAINDYCEITQIHAPLYGRIEANSTQLNDMAYFQCVDGYDMNVTAEPVKCIVLNQTHGQWSDYTIPECFRKSLSNEFPLRLV